MKNMKTMTYFIFLIGILFSQSISAQTRTAKSDLAYFDNWIGSWYPVVNGKIGEKPRFVVKQALYKGSFEETWLLEDYLAKAWRAWDSRTKKWDFAWMTDDGLFQIWDGRKVNGIWYMYKIFIIEGKEVLSRQAFIFPNDHTLIRTSEHSKDNGKTWRLRFKEKYIKRK